MNDRFKRFCFFFCCLVCFLFSHAAHAASPGFIWAKTAGREGREFGRDLAVWTNGDFLVVGYFNSTNLVLDDVTLTNNVLTVNPPGYNITMDCFVARCSTNGEVQWARKLGGTATDLAFCAAMDAQGNCYVAGSSASTNFSLGNLKVTNTMAMNSTAFFVAKLSGAGQPLWLKSPDMNYSSSVTGLAVDASTNVYVTGSITGTNVIGGTNFIAGNSSDILLLKYDAAGNLVWGQHPGGTLEDAGNAVAVDDAGHVYLLASFRGTNVAFGSFVFNSRESLSGSSSDGVVVKYDPSGAVLWARSFGGDLYDFPRSIAVDPQHNCYLAGDYMSAEMTVGGVTLTSHGDEDIFVAKFDSEGSLLWARNVGGDGSELAYKIVVDEIGNSYIGGEFKSTTLFVGDMIVTNFSTDTNLSYSAALVAKFDPAGNALWASPYYDSENQSFISLGLHGDFLYAAGFTLRTNISVGPYIFYTTPHYDLLVTRLQLDFPRLQLVLTNQGGSNVLKISWADNVSPTIGLFSTNLSTNWGDWGGLNGSYTNENGRTTVTIPPTGSGFIRLIRF